LLDCYEHVWRTTVAIVLGNFVFENEVISERIPGELRDDSVILMSIPTIVGENEIWLIDALDPFEARFDGLALIGEESIPEQRDIDAALGRIREQGFRTAVRLCNSCPMSAHDRPIY